MLRSQKVDALLVRSSLGHPTVVALRRRTPAAVVRAIFDNVSTIDRITRSASLQKKEVKRMTNSKPTTPARLRPGDAAPVSGIYQRNDGEQIVSTEGHPLPPGPKAGTTYKPVTPAKHKG
jgi:hypothetical protein